jgi:hypothetical protein
MRRVLRNDFPGAVKPEVKEIGVLLNSHINGAQGAL